MPGQNLFFSCLFFAAHMRHVCTAPETGQGSMGCSPGKTTLNEGGQNQHEVSVLSVPSSFLLQHLL